MSQEQSSVYFDPKVDPRNYDDVFPDINPAAIPTGNRVLVQLRKPRTTTSGGIEFVQETIATQRANEVVALVKKVGPLAYHSRDGDDGEMVPWGEGSWVQPGDLVRVIKYNGDRWFEPCPKIAGHYINFVIINDREIVAKIPSFEEARRHIAYVD